MQVHEINGPMMSQAEIKIIDDLLSEHDPVRCLEWGSGGSTLYFGRSVPYWLSVDHNGHYVQAVSENLPENVSIVWVPDNEWYVDCVKHSGKFDLILIDGLHRERCLEIAREIINPKGIILLHDSGRRDYQEFIKKHDGKKLSDGEEPYQGFYKHRGLTLFRGYNAA